MEARGRRGLHGLSIPGLRLPRRNCSALLALHASFSRRRRYPCAAGSRSSLGPRLHRARWRPFVAAAVGVGRDAFGHRAGVVAAAGG